LASRPCRRCQSAAGSRRRSLCRARGPNWVIATGGLPNLRSSRMSIAASCGCLCAGPAARAWSLSTYCFPSVPRVRGCIQPTPLRFSAGPLDCRFRHCETVDHEVCHSPLFSRWFAATMAADMSATFQMHRASPNAITYAVPQSRRNHDLFAGSSSSGAGPSKPCGRGSNSFGSAISSEIRFILVTRKLTGEAPSDKVSVLRVRAGTVHLSEPPISRSFSTGGHRFASMPSAECIVTTLVFRRSPYV